MATSVNIWNINGTSPTGWQGGNPKFGDLARTSNGNVWMNIGDNKQLSGWQLIGTQNQVDFDAGLEVSEEGSPVVTKALKMNFVGASVTATGSGDTATVNITGGGAGGFDPAQKHATYMEIENWDLQDLVGKNINFGRRTSESNSTAGDCDITVRFTYELITL